MRLLKFILIFLLCFPSFAGIKATRSDTNPSTYVDADGVIQLLTLSNTIRPKHYYDTTGFHALAGWMKEEASTNLILYTDGTSITSDFYTSWIKASSVTGTVTYTNVAIPELVSIANAKSQRVQYTGGASDTSKLLSIQSASSGAGTVLNGDVITVSVFARSTTGNTGVNIRLGGVTRSSDDASLSTYVTIISLTDTFKRFTYTFTVGNATSDRVRGTIGITSGEVDNTDTVDYEFYGMNVEEAASETSFIPTKTAALTRNAESYRCRKYLD